MHSSPSRRHRVEWAVLATTMAAVTVLALRVDVPRRLGRVKGDEATYVAMAMSLALDYDLRFERRDLDRFTQLYGQGPEGIFLKRTRASTDDGAPEFDRLTYGKALVHALVAVPYVRTFGFNGLLLLQLTLLVAVLAAGYRALLIVAEPARAATTVGAFVFASVTPVFAAWLTSDLLNFALVFVAYALVGPAMWRTFAVHGLRWIAAAVLVGLAAFSKPPLVLLIGPLVAWLLWHRRWALAGAVCGAFGLTLVLCGAATLLLTGELNYQGGDRKIFYGHFPYESDGATFDRLGTPAATEALPVEAWAPDDVAAQLLTNVGYFLVGRHFGLIVYWFPAAMLVFAALCSRPRAPATVLILLAASAGALALLVLLPFSWAGGGGPIGNRYYLPFVASLFFVAPPPRAWWVLTAMWVGGLAMTGHITTRPTAMVSHPWKAASAGLQRQLPVELTNAHDLPAVLDTHRAHLHITPGADLDVTFLDGNAYGPFATHYGVGRNARADVVITAAEPLATLKVRLTASTACRADVGAGSDHRRVALEAGQSLVLTFRAGATRAGTRYAYLLSVSTRDREPMLPLSASPPLLVEVLG